MGQVESSKAALPNNWINSSSSPCDCFRHRKKTAIGKTVSSPAKRNTEKLDHSGLMGSRLRRNVNLEEAEYSESVKYSAMQVVATFLLNLLAPDEPGAFCSNHIERDCECMEPADLSVKKTTTAVRTPSENPQSILTYQRTQSEAALEERPNCARSQAPEKSPRKTASNGDGNLRKMMRTRYIKRKQKGRCRQVSLLKKLKEMERRLSELKKEQELPQKEPLNSTGQPDLPKHAEIASDSAPQQQPPSPRLAFPVGNYPVLRNPDGTTTLVHFISANSVPNEISVAWTSTTSSGSESGEGKLYKCLEQGCGKFCKMYPQRLSLPMLNDVKITI